MKTNKTATAVYTLLDDMNDHERREIVERYLPAKTNNLDDLKLLGMGKAATILGVSRATLWRLEREGVLKSVEVRRGSKRFSVAELRRFAGVN